MLRAWEEHLGNSSFCEILCKEAVMNGVSLMLHHAWGTLLHILYVMRGILVPMAQQTTTAEIHYALKNIYLCIILFLAIYKIFNFLDS